MTAACASALATPLVIRLAWRFGIIDDPKKNKHIKVIHTKPIPRGGGLAIFLGFLISALLFLPIDKHLTGILVGASILVAVGLIDDKKNTSPYIRLALQFVAAACPIIAGIGIAFITNPLTGSPIDLSYPRITFELLGETRSIWILSDFLALFWIVSIMNFLNMGAKGVDGQLTGVVGIAALVLVALSLRYSADITEWPATILAAITAGAFLGFLPWHMYPQRIMPSFSGSNLGGYLLGVISILTTTKIGTVGLVLAVPFIDTGYAMIRRVLSGKSPVWGDRGHLHHKLLDNGMSKRTIAYLYWGVTALFGFLSLELTAENKLYTILGVALVVGGVMLWLTYRPKQS